MRLKATGSILCLAALLFGVLPAAAQDFRGRINGTVTDNTGAVLPGVTVTTTSPALIQPQVQVTGSDGSYRFQALPPGVYAVDFELTGFQTVKREGIRVVINQTLSVDQQLQVATLQETVTVTGESPVVDTTTTTMGTNFTKELLTEIPNARDVWAAMAQAPGMQMTAVRRRRLAHRQPDRRIAPTGWTTRTRPSSRASTPPKTPTANAGYFDFGSFEEFQVGGAGADASAFAGGAVLSISVKSGSDRFSGSWYSDYQNEDMIANNVPDYLQVANQKNEDGYFTRTPLARGNQIQKQYDLNGNVGGPLWRGKAWGFFSYRLNDQYKYTTGLPSNIERSKLTNPWTFKVTYQMTQNNQLIGFINRRQKLQDKRGISVTTPLSAAYYQSSENTPMKAEWTSVLGSRMFLDVMVGNWWNFFPLRPVRDYGLYDGPWGPGRVDTATSQIYDGGANNGYQDQKRWKPQGYVSLLVLQGRLGRQPRLQGRLRHQARPPQPVPRPAVRRLLPRRQRRCRSQIDIYNTSVTGINDVNNQSVWLNDTWKLNNRLTMNLGLRYEHYSDQWPEQEFAPNGIPALAGWNNPQYQSFIAPTHGRAQRTVANTHDVSPARRLCLRPVGRQPHGGQGLLRPEPVELGRRAGRQGEPGRHRAAALRLRAVHGDPAHAVRPERQPAARQPRRARRVQLDAGRRRLRARRPRPRAPGHQRDLDQHRARSGHRPVGAWLVRVQGHAQHLGRGRHDPHAAVHRALHDQRSRARQHRRQRRRAAVPDLRHPGRPGQDRLYTNPEGNDADFQTVEVALNRRFSGKWMVLTSAGYTWSKMAHNHVERHPAGAYRLHPLATRTGRRTRCSATSSGARPRPSGTTR